LFPIGIYVENNSDIPNLDIMIKWNAPLGLLPSFKFCPLNSSRPEVASHYCTPGACVQIPFAVPHEVVQEYNHKLLGVRLSGKELKSRDEGHHLLGNDVYIDLLLHLSDPPTEEESHSINAYVTYCLGNNSNLPLTMNDFEQDRNNSDVTHLWSTQPCPGGQTPPDESSVLSLTTELGLCSSVNQVLTPVSEQFRHRGIVYFFLTPEERQLSAQRVYLTSLLVLALSVLFTIAFCLTDNCNTQRNTS
jgi:hypothetical protein